MLALAFFSWWYSQGWQQLSKRIIKIIRTNFQVFSVSLLLKTLFEPWRRISTNPSSGLGFHIQAAIDNTISRFVGFGVRFIVILAALITTILLSLIGIIELVVWPFLPPALIVTIILGIIK